LTHFDATPAAPDRASELSAIAEDIRNHRDCGFEPCETCAHAVPGEGNPEAAVVFVGEAPGAKEDALGRPFVGASGKVLDRMLAVAGLSRTDVFITNVLKARPPANRDPRPAEIAHSLPWLHRQLDVIDPRLVVPVGRHAMEVFLPGRVISKEHGHLSVVHGRSYMPMFHPAAALRNKERMAALQQDMLRVGVLCGTADADGSPILAPAS
jgi:uracil-DNA glycosylase family 4